MESTGAYRGVVAGGDLFFLDFWIEGWVVTVGGWGVFGQWLVDPPWKWVGWVVYRSKPGPARR